MRPAQMRYAIAALLAFVAALAAADPEFAADGQLKRPANYREWVHLSSGLGMNYGSAEPAGGPNPIFDNVYVEPSVYREFQNTGKWREGTMFVLELRRSSQEGSINKGGRFQTALAGIEVEVKDSKRFPGGWGFFDFGRDRATATVLPQTAQCYSCHSQNGAVDNTFVQFYPTLIEVARAKGTFRSTP